MWELGTDMAGDDHFVTLIQVALEDEQIRKQILAIVRLDSFNRQSLLNSLLRTLTLSGAPPELIRILGYLREDDIAQKTKEFLEEER